MIKKFDLIIFFLSFILASNNINCRSINRPHDPLNARLETNWVGDNKKYCLESYDFESSSFFQKFDKVYVMKNLFPMAPITYRNNPDKCVDGKILDELLNKFIDNIYSKSKKNKKEQNEIFKILKDNYFDADTVTGSIIVKFKKYPFVVKLFFENPKSFLRPNHRTLLQRSIFYMGGGSCRYGLGFTRIKNLNYIKEFLENHLRWKALIDVPRKWYWFAKLTKWFDLTGYNVNNVPLQKTTLPSIYGVIADCIESERTFTYFNEQDRNVALTLTEELNECLDPNISNFVVEKGTGKLLLVDTEHISSCLGLRAPIGYSTYEGWYIQLAKKYMGDLYFRTKRKRLDIRYGKHKLVMHCKEAFKDEVPTISCKEEIFKDKVPTVPCKENIFKDEKVTVTSNKKTFEDATSNSSNKEIFKDANNQTNPSDKEIFKDETKKIKNNIISNPINSDNSFECPK
jgi:hypothetical protein